MSRAMEVSPPTTRPMIAHIPPTAKTQRAQLVERYEGCGEGLALPAETVTLPVRHTPTAG